MNADGSIVIIGMSVEDDRCPPQRGHVRAEAMLGGWVIRPVGPDGMQSHCTYIVNTDLKVCLGCVVNSCGGCHADAVAPEWQGYIPKSLVKSLTTKQASLVATICQVRACRGVYSAGAVAYRRAIMCSGSIASRTQVLIELCLRATTLGRARLGVC